MDKLFAKDLTTVFMLIVLQVIEKYKIILSSLHLDSTSLHLHGEYNTSLADVSKSELNSLDDREIKTPQPIEIKYGYSRDHRPDLKQFIIDIICSADGDIPVFFKSASGNTSDSSSFPEIILEYKKQMNFDGLMIADSALYSAKNIQLLSTIKWLTKVPVSIKSAKDLISSVSDSELRSSSLNGYSYVVRKSNYGDIEQKWLVVESSERKKSDLKKLEKKIKQLEVDANKKIKNLQKEKFFSHQEALKAVSKLSKGLKYHQIDNISYDLKKDKDQEIDYLVVQCNLSRNENAIVLDIRSAGRFILATNILDENL